MSDLHWLLQREYLPVHWKSGGAWNLKRQSQPFAGPVGQSLARARKYRSRVTGPLIYLDRQLAEHALELTAIGIADPAVSSQIYLEVDALPEDSHDRIRASMTLAPERFRDELGAFQAFEEIVFRNGPSTVPPPVIRARMIVLLYTSFVMLRDSLLASIRTEVAPDSVSRRIFEFLAKDDLRLFRISIAHGHWDYAEDFSGLVYWSQPSRGQPHQEFRVDEATFDFWHRLSRAASYAAVLALTDAHQDV